ncbi:MAG: hypothetical protein QUS08_10630, partial [Methanothrix sp.]|nr:hypothetical protein [Methanothrix sp.]
MRYSLIAEVLEKVSGAQRSQKAELLSSFLSTVGPKLLCPSVRLLLGELWPPWEDREMGIGPEHLSRALEEISEEDISCL